MIIQHETSCCYEGGAPCDPRFPHHNTNKHRVLTELLLSPAAAAMKNRVKG